MQPADFYTGLVADLYEPLKSDTYDPARYAHFIQEYGEPALELGCGDGDPLLELRRMGLDVDGIDSSTDMLDPCRRKAADIGMDVGVCHQRMEELDLPRCYRSIFLAGPTFTLLPDDDTALRALQRIRAHLDTNGAALVPLFIPSPTPVDDFNRPREVRETDQSVLAVSVIAEQRHVSARTQISTLRYQRHPNRPDDPGVTVDRAWTLHWHTREGFHSLATEAGLAATLVDDQERPDTTDDSAEFTFLLQHPQS